VKSHVPSRTRFRSRDRARRILALHTLAAGRIVSSNESLMIDLALRISAASSLSGVFVLFTAEYIRQRRELVRAEHQLSWISGATWPKRNLVSQPSSGIPCVRPASRGFAILLAALLPARLRRPTAAVFVDLTFASCPWVCFMRLLVASCTVIRFWGAIALIFAGGLLYDRWSGTAHRLNSWAAHLTQKKRPASRSLRTIC
jgi:hypothetical protein